MRVCLICEGSYPYVPGGVSSWVQMLITQFKDIDFVIWSLATTKEEMSDYAYPIPSNVKEIRTMYLGDAVFKGGKSRIHLTSREKKVLSSFISGPTSEIDWEGMLKLAKHHHEHLSDLLMSKSFFEICEEEYRRQDSKKVFHHFLWNLRGIYFPLMYILSQSIPDADIYHTVSAGYAGILGSCASYMKKAPLLLSEHGIYTREREEDIIRSSWVADEFKGMWIDFFKKLSYIAYRQASVVTSLFENNRALQIELKCPPEKVMIIPNGVSAADFASSRRVKNSDRPITIGAIVRVVPIKDIKTMLMAFDIVKHAAPNVRFKIMGNVKEDPVYYEECLDLLKELGTKDVEFLGQVNIREHLPNIDILVLSSISEGQPLAILEGLAAEIPFVSTNVGDCRAMLEGEREGDSFGPAGIIVPIMNAETMAEAILKLVRNPELIDEMGRAGRERVEAFYSRDEMLQAFHDIYTYLEEGQHGRHRL